MPNIAWIKIIRNSKSPIFINAGVDIANASNNVRIPLEPLTKRSTRPTLTTRITRRMVGENKWNSSSSINFSRMAPYKINF